MPEGPHACLSMSAQIPLAPASQCLPRGPLCLPLNACRKPLVPASQEPTKSPLNAYHSIPLVLASSACWRLHACLSVPAWRPLVAAQQGPSCLPLSACCPSVPVFHAPCACLSSPANHSINATLSVPTSQCLPLSCQPPSAPCACLPVPARGFPHQNSPQSSYARSCSGSRRSCHQASFYNCLLNTTAVAANPLNPPHSMSSNSHWLRRHD